jgi:hypothetical protein
MEQIVFIEGPWINNPYIISKCAGCGKKIETNAPKEIAIYCMDCEDKNGKPKNTR